MLFVMSTPLKPETQLELLPINEKLFNAPLLPFPEVSAATLTPVLSVLIIPSLR